MRHGWSAPLGLTTLLALLSLASGALAQAPPPPDAQTWVRAHDRNGDGKLDREEFHQAVIEAFFLRDTNKDGYLSIEEFAVITPEAASLLRSKPEPRLTLPEFLNALHKDFTAADTNDDGLLSVEEIETYMRRPH
jgi:Ca2+-binding EF-hand superfamily protein